MVDITLFTLAYIVVNLSVALDRVDEHDRDLYLVAPVFYVATSAFFALPFLLVALIRLMLYKGK